MSEKERNPAKEQKEREEKFLTGNFDSEKLRELLTESEQITLDNFRKALPELNGGELSPEESAFCTDYCLFRYLRAREWNLRKAQEMLAGTLKWRREFQPHKITAKDVLVELQNDGKMYRNGFDKIGRPILYMKPGLDNTPPSQKEVKLKYLVYVMEKTLLAAASKHREKITLLIDYHGASNMNGIASMKLSKEVLNILQSHYPERLGLALLFNAPWAFTIFWKLITPFIDPNTKKKINILTGLSDLVKWVDEDQLEECYGGKNKFKWDFEKHWNKEEEDAKSEEKVPNKEKQPKKKSQKRDRSVSTVPEVRKSHSVKDRKKETRIRSSSQLVSSE
eukprot:TRINITY_DN6872_c0_g1_i1.p1 TRINITY_DN6872_c0_g1~~TRINITY_DN6872_c0_g1_i1.p1  ORF type:complete len:336 (-),score=63.68 TRINITY_DN6872_c0_g1_i1:100-1107(-)